MGYYLGSHLDSQEREIYIAQMGTEFDYEMTSWDDIPKDKVPVIMVSNRIFVALGVCYSKREYEAFTDPFDPRPRKGYLVDRAKIIEMCPSVAPFLR